MAQLLQIYWEEYKWKKVKGYNMLIEIAIYITILASATLLVYLMYIGLGIQNSLKRILSYAGDCPMPTIRPNKPPTKSDLSQNTDQLLESLNELANQMASSGSSSPQPALHPHEDDQDTKETVPDFASDLHTALYQDHPQTDKTLTDRSRTINEEIEVNV